MEDFALKQNFETAYHVANANQIQFSFQLSFFFYIYNLQFFEQRIYSHQVLIYLKVRKLLQNRQIVEEQLD